MHVSTSQHRPCSRRMLYISMSLFQLVTTDDCLECTTRMMRLQPLLPMLRESFELWCRDLIEDAQLQDHHSCLCRGVRLRLNWSGHACQLLRFSTRHLQLNYQDPRGPALKPCEWVHHLRATCSAKVPLDTVSRQ